MSQGSSWLIVLLILLTAGGAYLFLFVVFHVRRLNDLNQSGWLMLLMLIPLVATGLMLYLAPKPGEDGANRYGAPALPPTALHYIAMPILPLLYLSFELLRAFISR